MPTVFDCENIKPEEGAYGPFETQTCIEATPIGGKAEKKKKGCAVKPTPFGHPGAIPFRITAAALAGRQRQRCDMEPCGKFPAS